MKTEAYKNNYDCWLYPVLPPTVRPAVWEDLFMPSGAPNCGKKFLYYSQVYKSYVASRIYPSTTREDLELMLNHQVIYVQKK